MGQAEMHILGIAGSLRRNSYNKGLLRAAAEDSPAGIQVSIFDLAGIPPFDQDLEAAGATPEVNAMKEAIKAADALLLAVPEHNYSFSGVLKNALDWASRPFDTSVLLDKPVALIGASTGRMGTARAQAALRPVLAAIGCHVMLKPELFVSQAAKVCDQAGNVIDPDVRRRVRAVVEALAAWTQRLMKAPTL